MPVPTQPNSIALALRHLIDRDALKKAWENLTSLDQPTDQSMAETGADIGAGFIPGVGQVQAGRDIVRSYRANDPTGVALAAAGLIPFAGGVVKAAEKATPKAAKLAKALLTDEARARLATEYPKQVPGVERFDPKKNKSFIGKELSPEEELLQKERKAAQKDIEAGNYTPFFNVDERYYVDPANYPLQGRTVEDVLPKTEKTIQKWTNQFDTPEARARLDSAYQAAKDDPNAGRWYAMGQLENEFVKELGEKEGRKAFKERFADAMAATTGGADPTANLLMSAYGNYMKEHGLPIPSKAYDMPHPIGGRYVSGNMAMYDKVVGQGAGLTTETPKRFNFASNFMGHLDRPTIDEQMTGIIDPKLTAPPGETYGIMERMVNEAATRQGIAPGRSVEFQDVAWAGQKSTQGKPMIQHVNEAIERTSRVTGKSPQDVLRGYIRGQTPLYGLLPFAAAPLFVNQGEQQE